MIELLIVISETGLLRIIKNYGDLKFPHKQLAQQIYEQVQLNPDVSVIEDFAESKTLVYRKYSDFYIAVLVDDMENELVLIDFMNLFVLCLEEAFYKVSDLDFVNNPQKVYLLMDEMILGGMMVETDKTNIVKAYKEKADA